MTNSFCNFPQSNITVNKESFDDLMICSGESFTFGERVENVFREEN